MFNDFTSSSSLNYIDPFQIVIDSITMDNPTADVSFIFENSGIIKEVKPANRLLPPLVPQNRRMTSRTLISTAKTLRSDTHTDRQTNYNV